MSEINIFIAYARKDKEFLHELKTHLRSLERRQLVSKIWYDGEIIAGQKWDEEIKRNLELARIVLLLISADFIASDYCYIEEMKCALERHKAQAATVIPVIIRACNWEDEEFATLQIPNEGKPFPIEFLNRDPFYDNVVKAIKQVIQHQQPEPQNSIPKIQNPKSEILFPKMIFVEESSNYNGRAIKDFWIGQYPVTNEEYACFLNNYKSDTVKAGEYKGQIMIEAHAWGVQQENEQWQAAKGYERHPVICVSWYGANEYCNWLKITTGENYQLPNEWYWEWVARGGKKSKNYEYAGSNNLNEVGWYNKNSGGKTHQVGELNRNELGLYDMSGNVWEWCENYDASTSTRAVRGGSWSYIANVCRSSFRDRGNPFDTNVNLGFRVVRC